MGRFAKFFAGIQQAEFYKERLAEAINERREAESAIRAEIERNRLREQALIEQILEMSGVAVRLPQHAVLQSAKSDDTLTTTASEDVAEHTKSMADDVRHRAQEFIRAADERGTPYTEAEITELYKKIEESPDIYLV